MSDEVPLIHAVLGLVQGVTGFSVMMLSILGASVSCCCSPPDEEVSLNSEVLKYYVHTVYMLTLLRISEGDDLRAWCTACSVSWRYLYIINLNAPYVPKQKLQYNMYKPEI